jgi:hypothetical protein
MLLPQLKQLPSAHGSWGGAAAASLSSSPGASSEALLLGSVWSAESALLGSEALEPPPHAGSHRLSTTHAVKAAETTLEVLGTRWLTLRTYPERGEQDKLRPSSTAAQPSRAG